MDLSQAPPAVAPATLAPARSAVPAMARALKAAFPARRIATRAAPDWVVRAAALVLSDLRPALPFLGRSSTVSNAKARSLLGMEFIPVEDALLATARSLVGGAGGPEGPPVP